MIRHAGVVAQAAVERPDMKEGARLLQHQPEAQRSDRSVARLPYKLSVVPIAERPRLSSLGSSHDVRLESFRPQPVSSVGTRPTSVASTDRLLMEAKLDLQPVPRNYLGETPVFEGELSGVEQSFRVLQKLQMFEREPTLLTKERVEGLRQLVEALPAADPDLRGVKQVVLEHLANDIPASAERVAVMKPALQQLEHYVKAREPELERALDGGRAQSQIRANHALWDEAHVERLSNSAGGDVVGERYSPSETSAKEAAIEAVQGQGMLRNGLGKFPHNVTPLVHAAVNGRNEVFRSEVQVPNGVAYGRLGFTGIYYSLGAIQSLISARMAHTGMKEAQQALDTYKSESAQFLEAQKTVAELAALSRIIRDEQAADGTPPSLVKTVADAVTAGKVSKEGLSTVLQTLFVEVLEGVRAALDAYVGAGKGSPEEERALVRLQGILSEQLTPSQNSAQLSQALKQTDARLQQELRRADEAHKQLTKLVAHYGKDAALAKALRNDYKTQMHANVFTFEVWGLAIVGDGLAVAQRVVAANTEGASLAASTLGYAAATAGVGVGVASVGLSAYDASLNAIRAYKHHQTGRKAEALHRLFAEQQEVPVSGLESSVKVTQARDAELAGIMKTIASNQSQARNTKIGQAVLSALDGLGFAALTGAGIAGIVAGATGSVAAAGVAAAAGPVGAAFGGAIVLAGFTFAGVRLIKWGMHHHRSKQLQKVIAGDPEAMRKYARKHGLGEAGGLRRTARETEIKQHAIEALTKHSAKFALHRLHQRLVSEIAQVDVAHWDQSPAIAAMKCFFDEPAQIQALASISTEEAVKVMAKTFQVRV